MLSMPAHLPLNPVYFFIAKLQFLFMENSAFFYLSLCASPKQINEFSVLFDVSRQDARFMLAGPLTTVWPG